VSLETTTTVVQACVKRRTLILRHQMNDTESVFTGEGLDGMNGQARIPTKLRRLRHLPTRNLVSAPKNYPRRMWRRLKRLQKNDEGVDSVSKRDPDSGLIAEVRGASVKALEVMTL
jgi:hypothetical protein